MEESARLPNPKEGFAYATRLLLLLLLVVKKTRDRQCQLIVEGNTHTHTRTHMHTRNVQSKASPSLFSPPSSLPSDVWVYHHATRGAGGPRQATRAANGLTIGLYISEGCLAE